MLKRYPSYLVSRIWYLVLSFLLTLPLQAFAQDYDSLIRQAVAQRNAGDMEAAEATLRQAYDIPPDKTEVAYLLGMVVAFQERFDEALDILDAGLAGNPDDVSLNLGRARVMAFQGRYRQAEDATATVLANDPNNLEALNLAGRVAFYQQQNNRARGYFERALVLDSGNLESLTGLYDVERASGNGGDADRYLAMAADIDPNHIDVLSRQDPGAFSSAPRHQLTTTFANSDFDLPGFPEWYERSLEYRHLDPNGSQQYVRVEHNHRFGAHDTFIEGGLLFNQDSSLPLEIAVGYNTDTADFSAEYLARLGARRVLHEASDNFGTIVLTGSYQHASYNNGEVDRLLVGFEYYLLNANAWLTPSIGVVRDQDGLDTFAWTLGAHWQVTGNTRIGVSYSDAPETENLITTGSKSTMAYFQRVLGSNLTLLVYYSRFERENSYTRDNVNVGLQYRF